MHDIYVWRMRLGEMFPFFCSFTLSKHMTHMCYFEIRKSTFHMEKKYILWVIGFHCEKEQRCPKSQLPNTKKRNWGIPERRLKHL